MRKKQNTAYNFPRWAKIRLDEMNNTLEAFNFKVQGPNTENKEKSTAALDRVYQKYSDFEKTIFKEAPEKQNDAHKAWDELEAVLEAFRALTMSEKEAFDIRAIAQRRAWQRTLDYYMAEVALASGQQRKRLEKALTKLNQEKDAAARRLDMFQKAGSESWRGMNQTLNDSREAFERAAQEAQKDFSETID